ncbi:MAG TPA: folylpolyglutamate synthase/dihydrofolate synthase family protein [Candidatus Polarisedimenticolia bacterium]|nr:folylpolyglutamate synthase/dihydrofolate synthase family protein [Candidatus Polarisedimenticolia bacterium]
MTHAQALAWLDGLESLGIQPGLERITALLARLGDPQQGLPSVIVAGTNGKGSVVAFLAAMLAAAKIEAGVYTSPHLVRFRERIRVGTETIGDEDLAALTDEVRRAVEAMRREGLPSPTYFEATTALAFLHFRRRRVPLAVLEVGMGGRYDATNVATPLACAITPIALDHMQFLGTTVAEIAFQKTGIVRRGVPVIVAAQPPEAEQVILAAAAAEGAPAIPTSACRVEPGEGFSDPADVVFTTPAGHRHRARLALRGDHQVDNAATAVLLAETLRDRGGFAIDDAAIERGLASAHWPGRLELRFGGAAANVDLLLDGAHNPAGCRILAGYLRRHQAARPRRVLLFAVMRDKPAAEMLSILRDVADEAVVTTLPLPRATPALDLERLARGSGLPATVAPDPAAALALAAGRAGRGGLVVACGSLYLVGALTG